MRLSHTVLLAAITALLLEKGNGNATVLVYLSHYYNPRGLKSSGECCDTYWDYVCGPCDHYFNVCLDKAGDSPADTGCQYGAYTTGVTANQYNITFSSTIGGTTNPIVLHFQRWPGSVLLKVQVWDDDYPNEDDFVEQLTATVTMNASRSRAQKRFESATVKTRTQLDFDIAVFCDENWYGPYCDIYCEPYRKSFWCGYNKEVCYPVWTGENCIENIDKCGGVYCYKPGGKCVDNYCGICECSLGYTGQTCYYEINECAPNPCLNEGTCVDKIGEFQCLCPLGFTGSMCEIQADASSCTSCDNDGTGSQASQTGFPILPVVISTAAVFLIVVIMLVVIWKVYQKQKRQTERESRTQAYAIDLDDIEPYYVSKSTRMQPMTDDNPYSEVEGTETGRNTYCNMHEAAANETNIYINQREETEAEANAYLHPRDDLQANTYLELLPNINQSEEAEAEANAYLHPRDDLQANTYLELLPN